MNIKAFFKNKNMKDLIITVVSQMIIMIIAFLTNKFVSMRLGTDGYSVYSIVKKTSGVISGIMAFSLGIALPRYCSLHKGDNKKIMRLSIATIYLFLTVVLITSLILIIANQPFSFVIFSDVSYAYLILPMICYSFSIAMTTILFSYYRGTNRFYWYNISQMIYNLIMLILCIIFGNNLKLMLILWGISCSIFGIGFFLFEMIRLFGKTDKKVFNAFSECRELFVYSAPRLLGEFALFGFTSIPLIQVEHIFGLTNTFMIATPLNFCGMVFPIFSFTGIILLPMVSEEVANKNINKSNSFISKMALAYIGLSMLGCLLVFLLAKYLIIIFFSQDYLVTTDLLKIMILSVIPGSIYYLYRNPLDAITKIPLNTISLAISLGILCGLIQVSKSYEQVCWAFNAAYLVLGILSYILWIIFRNRFNKKNGVVIEKEKPKKKVKILVKKEGVTSMEKSQIKKDNGITIKDIFHVAFIRKKLLLIVSASVFILAILLIQFGYNQSKTSYTTNYAIEFLEADEDGALFYPDGVEFKYQDLVKTNTLKEVIDTLDISDGTKSNIIDKQCISITKTSEGKYQLSASNKYFQSYDEAKTVLTALAEYPVNYIKSYYEKKDNYIYINEAKNAANYDTEMIYLITQENALSQSMNKLIETYGDYYSVNNTTLKAMQIKMSVFFDNVSAYNLRARIQQGGFLKNADNLEQYKKEHAALNQRLSIVNTKLESYYDAIDKITKNGSGVDTINLEKYTEEIFTLSNEKASLENDISVVENYLDQSHVDLAAKASLEEDLAKYIEGVSKMTEEYATVEKEILMKNTEIQYTNSSIVYTSGSISFLVTCVVSLVLALCVGMLVNLVLDLKKYQMNKLGYEEIVIEDTNSNTNDEAKEENDEEINEDTKEEE